jgi:hypothetical protein
MIIFDLLHVRLSLARAFSHQVAIEASKDKTLLFRFDELLKLSKEAHRTHLPLRDGGHRDGGPLPELRVLTAPMVKSYIQIPLIVKPEIAQTEATYITIPTHSSKHQNCHR